MSAKPGSPFAYLARAEYFNSRGWQSRGTQFAGETSREQFRDMSDYFRKAADNIKIAMTLNPLIVHSHVLLINMSKSVGLDARLIVEEALRINPYSLRVRQMYLFNLVPRWGGSIEAMEAFIDQTRPYYEKNPKLKVLVGRIPLEKGDQAWIYDKDHDKALKNYKEALKYGDSPYTLNAIGQILQKKKLYSSALDAFRKTLTFNSFDLKALRESARCAYLIGEKKAAYAYAADVITIDPDDAEAHNIIGLDYRARGKFTDAEREFSQAHELKPAVKAYKRNLDSVTRTSPYVQEPKER